MLAARLGRALRLGPGIDPGEEPRRPEVPAQLRRRDGVRERDLDVVVRLAPALAGDARAVERREPQRAEGARGEREALLHGHRPLGAAQARGDRELDPRVVRHRPVGLDEVRALEPALEEPDEGGLDARPAHGRGRALDVEGQDLPRIAVGAVRDQARGLCERLRGDVLVHRDGPRRVGAERGRAPRGDGAHDGGPGRRELEGVGRSERGAVERPRLGRHRDHEARRPRQRIVRHEEEPPRAHPPELARDGGALLRADVDPRQPLRLRRVERAHAAVEQDGDRRVAPVVDLAARGRVGDGEGAARARAPALRAGRIELRGRRDAGRGVEAAREQEGDEGAARPPEAWSGRRSVHGAHLGDNGAAQGAGVKAGRRGRNPHSRAFALSGPGRCA